MSKSLLRNNSQSTITLPPPYTGIIAPGDSVVLDDPPNVVAETLGIVPELISFLTVTQVPDAQPVDGHDRGAAAEGIARALASLAEPLDMNGQRIINAADPIDPQDIATKQYVDTHGGGGGGGGTVTNVSSTNAYLSVADGSTTPQLTVNVGTGATQVAAGTDTRFNPAPSVAGAVVYDTGAGYDKTAAGSVGQVLKVGAGGIPQWGADSTTPTGAAGGSLAGTYPNPTIAAGAISNNEVSATAAIATSKLSGALTDITDNGLAAFVDAATKVARTYYVSVTGNAANDGSIYKPFATIQQAHDRAATDFPGSEYVAIEVGPGDFTGDVSITRKNTLISGAGKRPETIATKIVGNVTVNPLGATSQYTDLVQLAGFFIAPPISSVLPAVKATGSTLFGLLIANCYLYTNNATSTASAVACDATHASRPRIVVVDSIAATEKGGPAIVQMDRGDVRFDGSRIQHNSGVTLGADGDAVQVLNNASIWINGSLIETRSRGAAITATGATSATKLLLTNSSVTTAYAGAEDTTHGVVVGNTGGGAAAAIYQTNFAVADVSAAVYAVKASGLAVVAYGALTFNYGTNTALDPTLTLLPFSEKLGALNLPSLTASLPLKLDASKNVTAAAISLSGAEVSGTLPVGKGGTGITTTPVAGGVVYGNGSTQEYTAVGTSGQPLLSAAGGTPAFGQLNLGTATNVTGTLPAGNQADQTMGGDVTGTTGASVVTALHGNSVADTVLVAGDAGKVLTWSGAEWAAATIAAGGGGAGGGGLSYYLNYGVAGEAPTPNGADKQLSLTFSTPAAQTAAVTAPNGGNYATLAQFVTPVDEPGATTIPPGIWEFNAYLLSSHIDGVYFRAAIYKWDGTTLSLPIATSENVELNSSSPTPAMYSASVYVPQTVLTASDRVVVRLEITRTTAAAHTVTGYFGDGTPSHVHTAIGAPGGTGLVKVVDGIVQAPASLLVNADVALDASIAVSKLDGNTGGGSATKVLHGSNDPNGAPSWGAVALGSDVSGQLPVANGGTGLSSGTSGGVPYFSGTGSIASSALLNASALMVGGGAGAAPSTLASLGISTKVLHGNDSGAPTWDYVNLAFDVSGTLPYGSGGTGSTTIGAAGSVPYSTSAALAYSDAGTAGDVLTSGGIGKPVWVTTLGYAAGGTGNSSAPTPNGVAYGHPVDNKIIYTSAGSVGQVLKVGSGGEPEWASDSFSGTLSILNGGTGATSATAKSVVVVNDGATAYDFKTLTDGQLLIGSTGNAPVPATLTAGTTTQQGVKITNAAGAITIGLDSTKSPTFAGLNLTDLTASTFVATDASKNLASITPGTNVLLGFNESTPATISVISPLSLAGGNLTLGTVPVSKGGTGNSADATQYAVVYASAINKLDYIPVGTTGQVLVATTGAAPGWDAVNLASAAAVTGTLPVGNGGTGTSVAPTAKGVIYASSTSAYASTAAGTTGQILGADASNLPVWTQTIGSSGTDVVTAGRDRVSSARITPAALTTVAVNNSNIEFFGQLANVDFTGTFPTLQVSGIADGTRVTLINESANTVTIGDDTSFPGTKIQLGGPTTRTIAQHNAISFVYDSTTGFWIESGVGGSGVVQTVTAASANNLITVGGTTANPTVALTGLAGANAGAAGSIPYFSANNSFAALAAGTAGQYLKSNGALAPAWASIPYDVAGMIAGGPPAGATIFYFKATRAFTISPTSTDHYFTAGTVSTGTAVFTVTRLRTGTTQTIFTATFSAGNIGAAISAVSGFYNTIQPGDIIKVVAPSPADSTLADVYWTLSGVL